MVRNNRYQGAFYFNTSNAAVGQVHTWSAEMNDYFNLANVNNKLAAENAFLRKKLLEKQHLSDLSIGPNASLELIKQFNFKVAKVVSATVNKEKNYLTINKGTADGIKPGMGVIAPDGIVGKVKYCSEHFSTITSILHTNMLVSAKIGRNDVVGSVKWDGYSPDYALLAFIPRHSHVKKGDKVVTSGFNNIYPEGVMIGAVNKFSLQPDESTYHIEIRLSTDFRKLKYVYVVENILKPELDSLNVRSGVEIFNDQPSDNKK